MALKLKANHLKVLSDSLMLQSQAMLFRSALSRGADVDALIKRLSVGG